MKGEHPIRMLCDLLGVSPSGYYRSRQQPPSPRQREDAILTAKITKAHQASRGTYGVPRIIEDLRAEGTRTVKRVAEELGVPVDRLYEWRRQFAERPGVATGALRTPEEKDEEIRRLRAQLVRMQEREIILKKSLGILSETPESGMPRSKP